MQTKRTFLRSALLCSSAFTMLATGAAVAQTTGQGADDDAERITITGTRIERSELTTPSPVQIYDAEAILLSGETDVGQLLRETPALSVSRPVSNSAQTGIADSNADSTGVSIPNLRNLGTQRTLTLVNGRRHVAAIDGQAAVDVATIPVALIERVEILTGGASSIYGADAVSGVVNFILKDDFEGLDTRAQFGISDEGDGEEYFLSTTAGGNFAEGRGNAVVNVEWRRQEFVFNGDRRYASQEGLAGAIRLNDDVAAALGVDPQFGRTFVGDQTLPVSSSAGRVVVFDTAFGPFDPDGCLVPGDCGFNGGLIFRDGGFRDFDQGIVRSAFDAVGGDGIATTHNTDDLIPETERYTGNAYVTFDLIQDGGWFGVNTMTWFAESKFNHSSSRERNTQFGFNDSIPIRLDNPFISGGLADVVNTAIGDGITPAIEVYRDPTDLALRRTSRNDRDTFRIVTGFNGELWNGWDYEFHYNFGRTSVTRRGWQRVEDRYFASIDAIALDQATLDSLSPNESFRVLRQDGSSALVNAANARVGDIVCRSEITGEAPGTSPFPAPRPGFTSFDAGDDQCVPTNIFGDNAINPFAADFFIAQTVENTEITQETIGFVVDGDLGEGLQIAGPIGFAAGFEYRDESSDFLPDPLTNIGSNTFGGIEATTPSVIGQYDVWEVFGEISVPLIVDKPLFQSLTADASVRRSDYSTAGAVTAYGTGGAWVVNDDFRLRGSYNRAVRAPNITELFSPPVPTTIAATADPCNPDEINAGSPNRPMNCALLVPNIDTFNSVNFLSARVFGTTGGNPDLNVERARTYTVGGVFTPQIMPNLSAVVDFYDIRITDAINDLTAFEIAERCVDAPTINNQFCDAIDRDPTFGFITNFRSGQQNIAAFEHRGIDFTVNYSMDLEGMGTLDLRAVGTRILRQRDFPFQDDPTLADDDLTEIGNPKYLLNLDANWSAGPVNVNWQSRWQSSQFVNGVENEDVQADPFFCIPCKTGGGWVHDVRLGLDTGERSSAYMIINNLADRSPFLTSTVRPINPIGRSFLFGFTTSL